nr:PIN domain-containing protein [Deinococcus betulae]
MLLDASAVIALWRKEPGYEAVRAALTSRACQVSSVTLTELEGKLVGKGDYTHGQVQAVWGHLAPLVSELAFDAACRARATFYYARKNPYSLSLGDAACLGTAEAHGLAVLTAEQNWARLPDLPFVVELIR